jgi:hypothetical protein
MCNRRLAAGGMTQLWWGSSGAYGGVLKCDVPKRTLTHDIDCKGLGM